MHVFLGLFTDLTGEAAHAALQAGQVRRIVPALEPRMRTRALVIDDEETTRDACTQTLERDGFEVRAVDGGRAGLALAREWRPEAVVVDLKMPGMSGEEFLKAARGMEPWPVIIVITGYATEASAAEAVRNSADGFLAKPFTPQALRGAVRKGLERRAERDRCAARGRDGSLQS